MTGSISEPSIAVVAMVEPEMAENTVPATTATTASRPGTCRISRSMPSITLMARPVWNRTSPISTNSGIGVSEKLMTESTLLRTTCASPASPPRNSQAPTILMATNDSATGMPRKSSRVDPPSSSSAANCHDMGQRASDACERTAVMTRTPRPCAARARPGSGGACGRGTRPPAAGTRAAAAPAATTPASPAS